MEKHTQLGYHSKAKGKLEDRRRACGQASKPGFCLDASLPNL
ncbi:hypothetical protein QUA54_04510 [Microcoleus sp. MOSTC5]